MARGKGFRTKGASFPLQVAAILLFFVLPLRGTQSNYRLCFTQVVGLPITNPNQPPTIDGVISGDPGWTQAWRYVFGNGTNGPGCTSGTPCSPNVAVQGIKDNTFLYLSFEVNHDHTYDDNDLIVITLSPTGNPGDDRRIHIYPNRTCVSPYIGCSPPKGPGSAPRLVEYWTNSSTWNTTTNSACLANPCDPNVTDCVPPNATLPAGFDVKVSNSGANNSQNVSWFVEVKLPIAAFQIPTTSGSTFGLYFDVIRIDGNTGGYSEYYWPPNKANGQTNGIGCAVETNTPSPSDWGNGTVNPNATTPCYGVNLDWTDITSNHSQDQIDVTSGNAFTAQLKNNSVDGTGAPVPANQITAVFSIANFGLPSNWTPVRRYPGIRYCQLGNESSVEYHRPHSNIQLPPPPRPMYPRES